MTVSTEISSNEYTGNGVTTDFDYKFRIFKASDLSVTTSDADGDNVVTLRLGTDYTVTEVNKSAGGKVLLTRPLADKHQINIARVIPIVQETSFRNQGKFLAETHEDAFDYLTMLMQRVWGSLSLFLKRPSVLANWFDAKNYRISNLGKPKKDSDAVDLGTMKGAITTSINRSLRVDDMDILALPKVSERRNKQIGFDNAGIPILLDPSETGGLGYVLVDSFEKGALITARYQALHFKFQGEYYRWDGDLPKQVPAGSTPQSTGGIGKGAWISIGDASLRSDINKYNLLSKYGLDESGIIAARAAFDATGVKTYVPDITIDVSFDSEYKLNHLVGVGKLNWNGRVFDIGLASGYKQLKTVGSRIADMSAGVTVRVGCIGDSTTDGYGTEPFSDNPFITGSDGKKIPLSTTNHSDNGGVSAWPTKLRTLLRDYHRNQNIEVFNGGYGGTGIGSPVNSYCWPYKHYERIFFENEFYAAPHLTIISFGINEAVTTDVKRTQDVINGYRELIYKIKGFGATPVVITPDPLMLTSYSKKSVEEFIPAMKSLCIEEGVTLIDTHKEIRNFWANSEYAWGAYQTDGVHQKTIAHDFKSGFIAKNLMGAAIDVLEDNYISSMEQYAHPLNQQPTRNFQNNKFGVVGNCVSSQSFDFWVYVSGSNFNAVWYDFNANYVKSDAISTDDMYSFTVKSAINYQNAYISKNGRQNYPSSVTYSDSPNLLGGLKYGLNRITVKMPSSNCAIGRYSGYLGVHKKTVTASSQSYLTKIGKRIYEPAPKIINNVVSAANVGDVSYISLELTLSENVGFIVIEDKSSESVTSSSGWALYRSGRDNVRLFKYKNNSASDLGVVFTDYADNYPCTIKLEINNLGNKTVTIYDKSANVVFTGAELETCGHVGGIWGGNDTGGNVAKHASAIVDIQKVI